MLSLEYNRWSLFAGEFWGQQMAVGLLLPGELRYIAE
jgi:hypothetical protein